MSDRVLITIIFLIGLIIIELVHEIFKFIKFLKESKQHAKNNLDPEKTKEIVATIKSSNKDLCDNKLKIRLEEYKPKVDFHDIFISYRRKDGREYARCIQLALKLRGYNKIFLDLDSIKYGKFPDKIVDAIYSCEYFILILSPKSLNRCILKRDSVAQEIRTARYYHKTIIPIVIDGKQPYWPWKFLSHDLREIQKIQYHDHKTDAYFESSIDKLCERFNEI